MAKIPKNNGEKVQRFSGTLSAGEIMTGQIVTIMSLKPEKKEVLLPTGDVRTITESNPNPNIKGIPFKVMNVCGPLVLLNNICNFPSMPRIVTADTRFVDFMELSEEYFKAYQKASKLRKMPAGQVAQDSQAQGLMDFLNGENSDEGGEGGEPLPPTQNAPV